MKDTEELFMNAETSEDLIEAAETTLFEIKKVLEDVIAASNYPSLDPQNYFLWMYSVEPYAEA